MQDLACYGSIQKLRYGDGFDLIFHVDDSANAVPVPRFILQPLVENAIIHGMPDNGRIMTITVSARCEGPCLHLTVADDGTGLREEKDAGGKSSGIGLSNVAERIRLHYGSSYGVSLSGAPDKGTVCEIIIPLQKEVE
ncbi:MAG: hypothetical protein Q4C54_04770 [Clostridia bacterium]|nr:hypothetical protein [Clostridia bacterium]